MATPVGSSAAPGSETRQLSPLEIFQRNEDRLFTVGYKLAASNAAFCANSIKVAGFLIHDAQSYSDADAVRAAFHLTGDMAVQSVAPGSPAAQAGLRQNDTILSVNGRSFGDHWPPTDPSWKRAADVRDTIDSTLAGSGFEIVWQHEDAEPQTARIEGVPACPTRFELLDSKASAAADGERVLVGENFPGLQYKEALFAASIAHEMAHNIFRHPQTFETIGRKQGLVRISERDADRLMPWLLFNAGYDPQAAITFMETWGPRHGGGILRKRTHDGWDERVEYIEAEMPKVKAASKKRQDGLADWSLYFTPELPASLPQG